MFFGDDRKKTRLKSALLRELYQNNLRILGKQEKPSIFTLFGPLFQKVFLVLFLSFGIIAIDFQYPDPALLPLQKENSVNATDNSTNFNLDLSGYRTLLAASSVPISQMFDLRVRTIIIDPGHGGEDKGAVGSKGTKEKHITLDIAQRLRNRLQKNSHFQIYMTRESDADIPINRRIEFANSLHADIYISIHVNSVPYGPINIIETYYFGPNADHETLRLSELENGGSQYSLADFKEILQKIGNTVKLQESKTLATAIQRSLYRNISRENREIRNSGIKTAPFAVLLGVDMPSVLTEISCISNEIEEEKLVSAEYREEIARFLEQGINDYLNTRSGKGDMIYEAKSSER